MSLSRGEGEGDLQLSGRHETDNKLSRLSRRPLENLPGKRVNFCSALGAKKKKEERGEVCRVRPPEARTRIPYLRMSRLRAGRLVRA